MPRRTYIEDFVGISGIENLRESPSKHNGNVIVACTVHAYDHALKSMGSGNGSEFTRLNVARRMSFQEVPWLKHLCRESVEVSYGAFSVFANFLL